VLVAWLEYEGALPPPLPPLPTLRQHKRIKAKQKKAAAHAEPRQHRLYNEKGESENVLIGGPGLST